MHCRSGFVDWRWHQAWSAGEVDGCQGVTIRVGWRRRSSAGCASSLNYITQESNHRTDADLGAETNAHLWPNHANDEDAESDDESRDVRNFHLGKLSARLGRLSLAAEDVDAHSDASSSVSALSRVSSSTSLTGSRSESGDPVWAIEVADSFQRALVEGHSVDDAAVELKTMRMAFNVETSEVRQIVLRTLARHVDTPETIRPLLLRWKAIVLGLRDDDDEVEEGAEDILTLQKTVAAMADVEMATRLFAKWLRELYQEDVVSPEAVLAWSDDERAIEGAATKSLRVVAQGLVDLCVHLFALKTLADWARRCAESDDDEEESE